MKTCLANAFAIRSSLSSNDPRISASFKFVLFNNQPVPLNANALLLDQFEIDGEPETKLFVDLEQDVPGHLQADEDAEDPSKKTDMKAATKRGRPKKMKM